MEDQLLFQISAVDPQAGITRRERRTAKEAHGLAEEHRLRGCQHIYVMDKTGSVLTEGQLAGLIAATGEDILGASAT